MTDIGGDGAGLSSPGAGAVRADIAGGAGLAVVTWGGVVSELTGLGGFIAGVIGTEVVVGKGGSGTIDTLVVLAGLSAIAEGAIVAVGIFEAAALYFGLCGAGS